LDRLPPELLTLVVYDLNIAEILDYGRTCSIIHEFVRDHIQCTVRQIFLRHNIHPGVFFELLTRTHSVVSGSTVLLALLPWTFEPGDIDIYVPCSQANSVLRTLHRRFGFRLGTVSVNYLDMAGVRCVYALFKGPVKINVVISHTECATDPIFFFHSTAVMNFIDAFGIYCAYPCLTLQHKSLMNSRTNDRSGLSAAAVEECVHKYEARGFQFSGDLSDWVEFTHHVCEVDPYCPLTVRRLHDNAGLYYRSTCPLLTNRSRFDRPEETWCLDQQISPLKDLTCVP
jgi:hypothetical protein